jgi:general secretion pathway protein D
MRYRRIALKASVPLLTGCVAFGLSLPAASQAAFPAARVLLTAPAALGQFAPQGGGESSAPTGDARQQSEKLLSQARKAMKQGDFEAAEALIVQAEKLDAKYDPLTERFVDTPPKIRKLLAEERVKVGGTARLPAQPATTIPGDPFVGTPPAGGPAPDPQAAASAVERLMNDGKSKAVAHLKDARQALAAGDKFAALAAWQKAAGIQASYGPSEDSPQRIADELIRAGIDPSRLIPAPASPASPYTLRPSDVEGQADRLPQFSADPNAIPAAAAPGNLSPYNLPAETNPLAASPAGGGQFAPPPPVMTAPGQPAPPAPGGYPEPRRLAPGAAQRLPVGDANSKDQAAKLVAEARLALDKGDLKSAKQLAEQAETLNVPDTAFASGETRPWQMVLEVSRAMYRREGVQPASGVGPASPEPRYPVAQGVYNPATDKTKTIPAGSQASVLAAQAQVTGDAGVGQRLYQEGIQALQAQDRETALQKFQEAWKHEAELDPETRQALKDKLTLRPAGAAQPLPAGGPVSPLEQVSSQQELLRQKLIREILNEEKAAEQLAGSDPRKALANMQALRDRVAGAEVDAAVKKQLLTMVDGRVNQLAAFLEQNKATIENAEKNDSVKAGIVRDQELKIETQNKLAELVEQFNKLMDEKRFAEAEVIARQARDIAPQEAVVVSMIEKARFIRNYEEDESIRRAKEDGFVRTMQGIDKSSIMDVNDDNPLLFNRLRWEDLAKSKYRRMQERTHLSPVEVEIQKSLSKHVEVKFVNRPLSEVMDTLARMTGINVHLDPQGLGAEGVTVDTPVTLSLQQPISLRSALNLLLSPLQLSYVIQNEVLQITSEQTRDQKVHHKVYYAADLVIPIPNFVPSYNMGLPGALRESLNALGYGMSPRAGATAPLTVFNNEGQQQGPSTATQVLAQFNQFGQSGPTPGAGRQPGQAGGPGGLGGGSAADFGPLIDLITTTISPQSWDDVGGPGSIEGFDTNLSLVVSQTQEVHEQIADLLEQLRRLQDLQVTIEVRFITLSDNFFERIGVDFDFNIDDNTHLTNFQDQLPAGNPPSTPINSPFDDDNKSIAIGWTGAAPTADLDLKFSQGSFTSTPQFGNFDVNTAANFGFAILSDIEVFFLIQAAQGDNRTNILQAPKVTLFNGQTAFVSDTTQRPFVTSVIPVVGDFAAAQQPVIVVLNEGTSLSVSAVVSADRRFVRLTLVPFFSQIGDVDEFTFNGSVTTDSGTTVQDPTNPDQTVTNGATRTVQGTTVQLPTFAFTSVTTTVSVPDGGTVLLGGVKRLREGRTERGVPILSKVPWISRLFRNVGIGREAQSLMMMVTPRIIIQEEEEEKLGIELPQ